VIGMDVPLRRDEEEAATRHLLDRGEPAATRACEQLEDPWMERDAIGLNAVTGSSERPEAPLLSLTPKLSTARRLALVWGVHSVLTREIADVDTMTDLACKTALEEGFAKAGDNVVIAAGVPFGRACSTNLLRLASVWPQKPRTRKKKG
jgi:pyruvate kinase